MKIPITLCISYAVALWCCALSALPTFAQSTDGSQVKSVSALAHPALTATAQTKLNTSVLLMLGEVPVTELTSALSKQTGLTVTAAPYLRDRTVITQMRDISAAAALDAICELHDWSWRETEPGQIRLTRRLLNIPQEPTFVPRLLENALPADMRAYFHIPRPSDNRRELSPAITLSGQEAFEAMQRNSLASLIPMRDLRATLVVEQLTKKDLPYSKLTEAQKKQLLSIYVYESLDSLRDLLKGNLPARLLDPGSSRIHFDEKTLNFQGPGFGAYIENLKDAKH